MLVIKVGRIVDYCDCPVATDIEFRFGAVYARSVVKAPFPCCRCVLAVGRTLTYTVWRVPVG